MRLGALVRFSFFLTVGVTGAARTHAGEIPWIIQKSNWTSADEKNYSNFVAALGNSNCHTVDRCLKNPANPYRSSDPQGAVFDADCGKFPYLLRAYFAWKNGLPFGYVSEVEAVGASSDLRYSPEGNYPVRRRDLLPDYAGYGIDGYRALQLMQDEVNTAMFRIHPGRDGLDQGLFSDFYSVRIDRESVRPGTVIYDPAGHVVVVYKVETDGRVRFFDAHPDKTVSRGVYGAKFARSRPGAGAGFKNFRPLGLVDAAQGPGGDWYGGRIITLPLAKTPGYSTEQFFGTEVSGPVKDSDWLKAKFKVGGQAMAWQDFVRTRLAVGELKYHPVEEMQNAMDALCGDLQDRATAVQTAAGSGIANKPHPERLPNNIYGTDGDWEEFSSPSRDARLKTSFVELRNRVQEMVELQRRGDPRVDYHGTDLPGDLRKAYQTSATSCVVQYKHSNGAVQRLGYDEIVQRLFALSFDPYHCVELRWGASSADELASCGDGSEKTAWYQAEQRLRNQIERTYDAKMGFSLQDLQQHVPGSGVDRAPDVDLKKYLSTL